jgi:hypothetical protein
METPRSVSRTDILLLGLLIAALTSVYAIYALRVGNFQNDEEQYLQLARYIAQHFPGALWQSGLYPRGTQRLDPLVLAFPFWLLRGPGAYQLAHIIQCLLFVGAALPVFLLAHRAGLARPASLFAATLSVVVPWAVSATSFLAESAAYPVYAWVLYTTWTVMREPSTRHQALAILALVLATLARTSMLALVPVLPLAVLWHEWSWELRGKPRVTRAYELPARLWSRYRLLTVLAGLGVLTIAADKLGLLPGRGLAALAGGYGVPRVLSVSSLLERYRDYLARMSVGTGFLAVALALPWTLAALVRPRDGGRHAMAVVCALGLGAILLSLLQAGGDERYVLYGAVPISLSAAAALSQWAHSPPSLRAAAGVLIGAAAVVLLVGSTTWPALANPYDFFTYPAAIFYQRVLLGHASLVHLPLIHPAPGQLVEAVVLLAALAWVVAAGRPMRAARPACAVLGIGLVALCATQTVYSLRKFTSGAGGASGPNASARSWVDEHVPGGAHVGALALSMGKSSAYVPIWRATEFWNTSVNLDAFLDTPGALPLPLGSELLRLTIQPVSGLLRGSSGAGLATPVKLPRYVLVPQQGTNRVALDGEVVATDPYLPLVLMRLSQPARIDWTISGTSDEGFMASDQLATATVYGGVLTGTRRRCATFSLIAPPGFPGRWPYTVLSDGRSVERGSLVALQTAAIIVPLVPRVAQTGPSATLAVRIHGDVGFPGGLTVSAKLAFFSVEDCPRGPGG